jgi:hypothetical protein
MATIAVRILFTGKSSTQTTAILTRLGRRGWGSYGVDTVSESKTLMETFKFDVVLALEKLNDGRGYDLAEAVKERGTSLLVGIELSDTHLWLPVVYHGKNVQGECAINSEMIERELAGLLFASDRVPTRGAKQSGGTHMGGASTKMSATVPPEGRIFAGDRGLGQRTE